MIHVQKSSIFKFLKQIYINLTPHIIIERLLWLLTKQCNTTIGHLRILGQLKRGLTLHTTSTAVSSSPHQPNAPKHSFQAGYGLSL